MKLVSYKVTEHPPISHFEVADLADVVVLAGPNGVGKTSLLARLLSVFQNPGGILNATVVVQATNPEEAQAWGTRSLSSAVPEEARKLSKFLQRNQKRGQLKSGVIYFDSGRQLEQIQPYGFTWDFRDPFAEDVGWKHSFQPMKGRFQDTIHSLHRKIRSQKEDIAKKAIALQASGEGSMVLDFRDPLERFYEAFAKLLPGRQLAPFDEQSQTIRYKVDGTTLQLESLSSGEKEVVTIVFDFLLRDPRDCIIVFDEPELHLHPELSYRLLRTLRDVGERNQFIYCTHSPDIITASLDHSVVFVAPTNVSRPNQAVQLREDDEAAQVLHMIGQSIGVIALGKRIVLIEGTRASIDKQTYGAIVGSDHPDLVLVPVGGKEGIGRFASAFETVLRETVWGVDFFMLCDGDASSDDGAAGGRIRTLPRYHIENFFLDEHILVRAFESLVEMDGSWLLDPSQVRNAIKDLAKSSLSYAASLHVAHQLRRAAGNVDLMPSGCHDKSEAALVGLFEHKRSAEVSRMQYALDSAAVERAVRAEYARLASLLERDDAEWQRYIPGKAILQQFAAKTGVDAPRMKRAYLKAAIGSEKDPFADVRAIFRAFSAFGER